MSTLCDPPRVADARTTARLQRAEAIRDRQLANEMAARAGAMMTRALARHEQALARRAAARGLPERLCFIDPTAIDR